MFELLAIGVMGWAAKRFLKGIRGGTVRVSTWQENPRAKMSADEIMQMDDPGQAQARRDDAAASLKRHEDAWFNH